METGRGEGPWFLRTFILVLLYVLFFLLVRMHGFSMRRTQDMHTPHHTCN